MAGPWRVRVVKYEGESLYQLRYHRSLVDDRGTYLAYIDTSHSRPFVYFACPICGEWGSILLDQPNGQGHTWNGDYDRPTFHPSLDMGCGFHAWVNEGKVTDAGIRNHGEVR